MLTESLTKLVDRVLYIMLARLNQFQVTILVTKLLLVGAISQGEFYPFGPDFSDRLLSRGDEAIASISDLPNPFPFFGELHRKIIVCAENNNTTLSYAHTIYFR